MGALRLHWPWAAAAAAYCAAIFALSSSGTPPDPAQAWLELPGGDKAAHAALFGGLAAVVSVGLRRSNPRGAVPPKLQFLVPFLFASVYGLSDEVHQLFVPIRTFEWLDLAADAAGAGAVQAYLCAYRWRTAPEALGPS